MQEVNPLHLPRLHLLWTSARLSFSLGQAAYILLVQIVVPVCMNTGAAY